MDFYVKEYEMGDSMKQIHDNGAQDRMKKQVKITKHQKKVLLDFLDRNFEYHRGAFKLLPDCESDDKNRLWEDITTRLNGIGPSKTSNMWRKTCADLRMQIKKKVIEEKELTDDDRRMAKFYALRSDPLDNNSRLVNDRVTSAQKTKMVELIRENFCYNQNTMKMEPKKHGVDWDEIGEQLNQVGGCKKTTVAWRKCWSDIKCDVGKKFSNGAVPQVLTESEYNIATFYGWFNGEQITTSHDVSSSPVQYLIDSTVIIKSEAPTNEEIIVAVETDDYEVEHLDEDEQIHSVDDSLPDVEMGDVPPPEATRTIYMTEEETQTDATPNDSQNAVLEQILAAQLRTNTLLEQLLLLNGDNNILQSSILDELKNKSFMMVNRVLQK